MNSIMQTKPIIMRRALQVFLPILCTLSLLISFYPSYCHSMELSYISQFINRKTCLLLLNAILLFVARDSGLLSPSVAAGLYDELVAMKASENIIESKASSVVVVEEVLDENNVRPLDLVVVEEEEEEWQVVECVEDSDQEECFGVDELNRRCEEFIEKFMRERKLEARQLVMV